VNGAVAPVTRIDFVTRIRGAHPAAWTLVALVLAGLALRIVVVVSVWPVTATLADATSYTYYATRNPLESAGHPGGYSSILAVFGLVSRDVWVLIMLQHLLGIATAIVFYLAVRRITGSPWPGLVPAAVVLLNADLIFLEHNVLSEAPFLAALSGAFYATARAFDAPDPWWRWPAAAAAFVCMATVIRATGLFLLPVVLLAILLAQPRPWRTRWQAPVGTAAVAALLLTMYASGNLLTNGRFEVGPAQGWHLYGRVARFADCRQFTPPDGTERLCEDTPVPQRPGPVFYFHDPGSPAARLWGPEPWREHDDDMRAFAMNVIIHQPLTYSQEMWRDIKAYFAPQTFPSPYHLDSELDWTRATLRDPNVDGYVRLLGEFFDPFRLDVEPGPVVFLHDYQRVFRFGATALSITTLLSVIGLLVGAKRERLGVLLLGVGGLALLVAPVLSVFYVARYTVPLSAPLAAAAGITAFTLYRMEVARRSTRVEDA
jgi:4-amino-4-deoxy-L-arabinose transferase-like glycosyltransferase